MTANLKILIVGGYGIFGGRIVALLEDDPRLTLFIAGRSLERASVFVASRANAKARLQPFAFDRNADVGAQLSVTRPNIVVDASGPFQSYGMDRYRIVEACLAHGASYLDLADGSDFVAGIGAFDERAKVAGLFVLSGVSSFPVLKAAAVRRLSTGMATLTSIRGGIAPSPFAVVGENVIRAIAGYAGRPIRRKCEGAIGTSYPFTEHMRYTIAPPGRVPLRNRLFSLVDVPDLVALPALWPDVRDVWMGAGPVPEVLHRVLSGLAWLTRCGLIPTLSPFAWLMHLATNHLRWGEHRGGMFVEIEGADRNGATRRRSWHLIADGDDGPFIPAMAVEAIVRETLQGSPPPAGARAAIRDLELDAYERLFARRKIVTGIRDDSASKDLPLYAQILGDAWNRLPPKIRDMHDVRGTVIAEGRSRVERGPRLLARIICAMIGFPRSSADTPARVRFSAANGVETWTRMFGRQQFESRQFVGRGRAQRLLCERFGPVTFAMALVVGDDDRLSLVLRRWSVWGVPLPMWLCPRSQSYESAEVDRFNFHVAISHPLTGLIIRYDGWLERGLCDHQPDDR